MSVKTYERNFPSFKAFMNYDFAHDTWGFVFGGSLETEVAAELLNDIKWKCLSKPSNFIIDIVNLRFISSTGIKLLLNIGKAKREYAYLSEPADGVKSTLELLDVFRHFTVYSSLEKLAEEGVISQVLARVMQEQRVKSMIGVSARKTWLEVLASYVGKGKVQIEAENIRKYIVEARLKDVITLPSEPKYIAAFYVFLEKVFYQEARFTREEIPESTLEFVAKEAMMNAIQHGYGGRKDGIIEISYEMEPRKVIVNVIDYGKGIGFGGKLKKGGGLDALRKIFDKVEISSAPKVKGMQLGKGTWLKLIKNIPK